MLVDENNQFITQRNHPNLALLKLELAYDCFFKISYPSKTNSTFKIPFSISSGIMLNVKIWDDVCSAIHYNIEADNWFSNICGFSCKLVYMPENEQRFVDKNFRISNETVSFADGYPYLIIGQESLNELNDRTTEKMLMNRFRPNIVFTGGSSFDEDNFKKMKIGTAEFYGVKNCARCNLTLINQENATVSNEPLQTLAKFRKFNNKILFGQNVVLVNSGVVSVGDEIVFESV